MSLQNLMIDGTLYVNYFNMPTELETFKIAQTSTRANYGPALPVSAIALDF